MLTFEALSRDRRPTLHASGVPFCRKHSIEPRAPETYFSLSVVDYLVGKVHPDFVRERRAMRQSVPMSSEVAVNGLVAKHESAPPEGWLTPDGSPWPGNDSGDHVGMIQVPALYLLLVTACDPGTFPGW